MPRPRRLNALKYGLLTKEVLLDTEDPQALEDLIDRFRRTYQPSDDVEEILVDRAVACCWELARAHRARRAAMDAAYASGLNTKWPLNRQGRLRHAQVQTVCNDHIERIDRHETKIENRFYRALNELRAWQATRLTGVPVSPGGLHVSLAATALLHKATEPGALPEPDSAA